MASAYPDSAEKTDRVGTIRPKRRSASCWKAFAVIGIVSRIVLKRTWASEVRNVHWAFSLDHPLVVQEIMTLEIGVLFSDDIDGL